MTDNTSSKIKSSILIKQYQIGESIGKGAVGEVFKALDTETAETVAIKQIDLHNISQEFIKSIETEINLLKCLDHPNIVKYKDFIRTKTHINIILEYVENGSLQQVINQTGSLGEHLVFFFVKQILEGLDYLHSQGIIHRDIKGANLLLTKNGGIKLADFGYSIKLSEKEKKNSMVGTSFWMAPEIIEPKGNISSSCDIWSLACTIIQLLTTKPPYYEYDIWPALFRILTDEHPPLPENISENLVDFLKKCFNKDPTKRPTARELLTHPWITNPNKKVVRKFINENDWVIPQNILNEWKLNYRQNLSSITSLGNNNVNNQSNLNIQNGNNNNMDRKDSGAEIFKEDDENHDKNDEELMVERDNILKSHQMEIKENEPNTPNNRNFKSSNVIQTNYLTNSLINNTQQSVENYNSFGGINQTFQTFKNNSLFGAQQNNNANANLNVNSNINSINLRQSNNLSNANNINNDDAYHQQNGINSLKNSSNLNYNNLLNINHNLNNVNTKKLNNFHSNSLSNHNTANVSLINSGNFNNLNLNKSSNLISQFNSNSNNNNNVNNSNQNNNSNINIGSPISNNNLSINFGNLNLKNFNSNSNNNNNNINSLNSNSNPTANVTINKDNLINYISPRNQNNNLTQSLFEKNPKSNLNQDNTGNNINFPLQAQSSNKSNNPAETKKSNSKVSTNESNQFSPKGTKKREKGNSLSFKKEDLITITKLKEKETSLEAKLKLNFQSNNNNSLRNNNISNNLSNSRKFQNKKSNENIQINNTANDQNLISNNYNSNLNTNSNVNRNNLNLDNLNNLNHVRSLSFQDENFIYRSKSSFSEFDFENVNFLNYNISTDINKEINILLENLKQYNSINVKNLANDNEINKIINELYLMKSVKPMHKYNKSDINFLLEIKTITDNLLNLQINSNEIIASLIYFVNLLNASESPKQLIESFFKNYSVVNLMDLINNNNNVNSRFLLVFLDTVNAICILNQNYIEEFITYQMIFYLMNLIFVFNDVEVKAQLVYFIFQILIRSQNSLKIFFSSGGFYLIPVLIDPNFLKTNDTNILILILDFLLKILEGINLKTEDLILMLLKNKILIKLNIIMIEIFSMENFLENESANIIIERILDICIKISEYNQKDVITYENMLHGMLNFCLNIPVLLVPKFFKFFENLLKDATNINKLENIGYIEFLLRLLNSYSSLEIDNASDQLFFQKISRLILIQIRHMIKLNDSRCEQIVSLDGIQTLMNLSKLEIYNNLIIPIICELISSTSLVRDALKKFDCIVLIYYTAKNTENLNFYHDIISFILYWLIQDKEYIENFITQEEIFFEFFNCLFLKLNTRLLDHLTLILEFFEASNLITNVFFQNNILVSQVVDNIIKNDLTLNKDVCFLNKILDFLDLLMQSLNSEKYHIMDGQLGIMLEKIKVISEKNNLVIIAEKIKNIKKNMMN